MTDLETQDNEVEEVEQGGADELAAMRDALKKANAEAKKYRLKLKELEEAEMSEAEKAKARVAELEAEVGSLQGQYKTMVVGTAVLQKAIELGFANPGDAMALLDVSGIEVDGDKVTGFEKQLETLAKSGRLPMSGDVQGPIGTPPKLNGGKGKPDYQSHYKRLINL